jgi:NhaA family Na+:H+ antiporter
VLVIALFYTATIDPLWTLLAVLATAGLIALNRRGVGSAWAYVALSLLLWFCVLNSGVHATIAGVVAALTIPQRSRAGGEPLARFEHSADPVVTCSSSCRCSASPMPE